MEEEEKNYCWLWWKMVKKKKKEPDDEKGEWQKNEGSEFIGDNVWARGHRAALHRWEGERITADEQWGKSVNVSVEESSFSDAIWPVIP